MDANGYHALTCRHGGHLGIRHHGIRDEVFRSSQTAHMSPGLEVGNLLPDSSERPADVLLGIRACDQAITHPCQPKYLAHSATTDGFACNAYAVDVKQRKYTAVCEANGLQFVPMVCSVFGEWCKTARPIFTEIANRTAARTGADYADMKSQLMQRLSMRLMRSNARALLQRMDRDEEQHDDVLPSGFYPEADDFQFDALIASPVPTQPQAPTTHAPRRSSTTTSTTMIPTPGASPALTGAGPIVGQRDSLAVVSPSPQQVALSVSRFAGVASGLATIVASATSEPESHGQQGADTASR